MSLDTYMMSQFMKDNPEYSVGDPEDNATVMAEFDKWMEDLDYAKEIEYIDNWIEILRGEKL